MTRISLGKNLDEVKISAGPPPLPVGEYELQLTEEPELTSGLTHAGEEYQRLEFVFTVVNNADGFNGRKLWHSLFNPFSDDTLARKSGTKATLVALGARWDNDGNVEVNVGAQCRAIVGQYARKDDSGKIDNRINSFVGVALEA